MTRSLEPSPSHPQESQRNGHVPDVLTQKAVCDRLGISDETWRRWRQRGITPPRVQVPGRPRWYRADVIAFEQGRRWRLSEGHAPTLAAVASPCPRKSVARKSVDDRGVA